MKISPKIFPRTLNYLQQKTTKTHFHCFKTVNTIHTLVELVDAEDEGNDNFRKYDLTLEINSITNQSQNVDTQQSEQRMSPKPQGPNYKLEPAYKKYCSYQRRNHPFQRVSKNMIFFAR